MMKKGVVKSVGFRFRFSLRKYEKLTVFTTPSVVDAGTLDGGRNVVVCVVGVVGFDGLKKAFFWGLFDVW